MTHPGNELHLEQKAQRILLTQPNSVRMPGHLLLPAPRWQVEVLDILLHGGAACKLLHSQLHSACKWFKSAWGHAGAKEVQSTLARRRDGHHRIPELAAAASRVKADHTAFPFNLVHALLSTPRRPAYVRITVSEGTLYLTAKKYPVFARLYVVCLVTGKSLEAAKTLHCDNES